ncbi:MAG: ATP-binding protein [Candidatus Neomarinimicrobiota bacterium]
MELAVKVMRQSVSESRKDGKVDPKVGVVLYKPDGTIETACRGELRHGDHAEYTLLERKNHGNILDGSILFATLEPCAKGARTHPKLSCAERIYLARIKEVWVGIQDPDPTVARKGIGYLIRQGVIVHMFDRDLQGVIEQENEEFLKQATERATEIKEEPGKIALSPLEDKLLNTEIINFSDDALKMYHQRAKITDIVGSDSFNLRLLRQGLLKEENGALLPTGFGYLLFGKEPRMVMPQAGLLGIIHYPNGDKERREFDEPTVLIPNQLEQWLKNKLPNVFDRSRVLRQEQSALPFEMVREAVINALIHRDYNITGAKCQLIVTEDTVTVQSPGGPPSPITLNQLQDFSAPMLSRNPELHFVFARMGLAEEQGLGLASLRDRAKELGLPQPQYLWDPPYLVLKLFRSAEGAVMSLEEDTIKALSKSEQKGWQWLATRGKTKSGEYADAMRVDSRTARRHLGHFEKLGLVKKTGAGPSLQYKVI